MADTLFTAKPKALLPCLAAGSGVAERTRAAWPVALTGSCKGLNLERLGNLEGPGSVLVFWVKRAWFRNSLAEEVLGSRTPKESPQ